MLKPDNDPIFSNKFRDFEPEHGDRWSQIEAALPTKKKRRGILWLWLGLGLIAGGGALLMLQTPKSGLVQTVGTAEKIPAPVQNDTEQSSETIPGISPVIPNPIFPGFSGNEVKLPLPIPSFNEWRGCGTSAYRNMTRSPYLPFPGLMIDPNARADSSLSTVPADSLPPLAETTPEPLLLAEGNNRDPQKGKNKQDPPKEDQAGKWSMGIGLGVYASRFTPKMPGSVGNYSAVNETMVKENHRLREQIEKPGYAFSQSLWISYRPTERWSFSSGISMVQSTQVLRFSIQGNTPDKVRSPGDFAEQGNTGPGGVYLFPNDSIQPGNSTVSHNKYLAREIPFFVSYHQPLNDKLSLTFCAGVTYRWVSSLSAFLPDVDNVGMVYMQGPEYYPGVRSTFHLQGAVGLNYRLNDHFSFEARPTFQLATRSNIRFEHYVQQYQKQWGCQFMLTRKLGF